MSTSLVILLSRLKCNNILTNSCPGAHLVRIFALLVHNIFLDNGLIGMIQIEKVFVDVLAMRFACSIMKNGPLVAKLWC
jgi:hypothetical protein